MILIVDDNASNRDYLATVLDYAGYQPVQASSGVEALETARRVRPPLVISDVLMPDVDGFELVRRLRAESETASIPVIFYSANYTSSEARLLASHCGVERVLVKPSEPGEILEAVASIVGTDAKLEQIDAAEFHERHSALVTNQLLERVGELECTRSELVESEARFRDAFEHTAVGIFFWDDTGAIARANAALRRMLGLPEGAPNVHGALTSFQPAIDAAIATGHFAPFETELAPFEGPAISVYSTGSLFADGSRGGVCYVMDLAERRAKEDALALLARTEGLRADVADALASRSDRDALERCAAAVLSRLDVARAAIWVLSEEDNRLELAAMAGLDAGERPAGGIRIPVGRGLLGRAASRRAPIDSAQLEADPDAAARQWCRERGLTSLAAHPLLAGDRLLGVVAIYNCGPLPSEATAQLASVAPSLALGLARRRAELERDRFFETAVEMLCTYGRDGRLRRANPSMRRALGYDEATLVCAPLLGYVHPDDREVMASALRGLAAAEPIADLESRLRTSEGEYRWLSWSAAPFGDDGLAYLAARDVTERKRFELELARSNAELEQFAYIASHDLQEPLRMVSSYVQLLANRYRGKLDRDADDFISFTVEGATRMQELINDLLSYSRICTRPMPPAAASADTALDRAMRALALAIEEAGVEVTRGPLPVLACDEVRLAQLLQNLLSNAIKFRGSSPPRVHVSAASQGPEWVVSVVDNGIGIEPKYAERIFGIFQRLHGRDRYPGTGIGLSIARRIVERAGGRIWIEPTPGGGTTFNFTMPGGAHGQAGEELAQ